MKKIGFFAKRFSLWAVMLLLLCSFAFGASAADAQYQYGYSRFDPQGVKVTQGYMGWYFLYSLATDCGDEFPLEELQECDQDPATGRWKVPDSAGVDKSAVQWFGIREDGFLGGGQGVSVCLKWAAPVESDYQLQFTYYGGSNQPSTDGDGVSFYIYHDSTKIIHEETDGTNRLPEEMKYNKTLTLKQGEAFYFIVDTKKNSNYDDTWWAIDITDLKAAAAASSAPEASSAPASSTPTLTPNPTTSSAASGDVSSAAPAESAPAAPISSAAESVESVSSQPASDAAATEQEGSGHLALIIVLILAGVLIVAAGVVVLVLYLKKIGPFAPKQ